ncbi:hypothetical protein V8G54_026827 [Vigna mungo]|uniref:DUF7054 domain-containing protein n=1 Tax=Vigna mungo TaxID=3915 RepID=A0AAQ3N0A0_VIGMU
MKVLLHNNESFLWPSKVLVNVSIETGVGAVQVVISPENTVVDLIKAELASYEKEKRRSLLKNNYPKCYYLHYSSFALQSASLKADEKLMNLGSRNFFLCLKPTSSSCSRKRIWQLIMHFLGWCSFLSCLDCIHEHYIKYFSAHINR